MTCEEAKKYFGSPTKVCDAIGFTRASFNNWRKRGYIPAFAQLKLQSASKGKLKAEINPMFKPIHKKGKNND